MMLGDGVMKKAAASIERRVSFVAAAQTAQGQLLSSGKGYDAAEVHAYLKARVGGKKPGKSKTKMTHSQQACADLEHRGKH